jgi:hypothetical protein
VDQDSNNMFHLLLIVCLFIFNSLSNGFYFQSMGVTQSRLLKMEYIPDGLSKEQWAKIKAKETEENKNKNLGAVGITKFKSRSFEAWQKSGQTHLFPVDSKTPVEARPYMQRTGGSADGSDLKSRGLKGKDQAKAFEKTQIDAKYEQLEKEGKLRSSPFSIPWTAGEAEKLTAANLAEKKKSMANKSPTKGATKIQEPPAEPARKKLFGIF